MIKGHQFNKKANQQFQTLSSIDSESHKIKDKLDLIESKDPEIRRLEMLN